MATFRLRRGFGLAGLRAWRAVFTSMSAIAFRQFPFSDAAGISTERGRVCLLPTVLLWCILHRKFHKGASFQHGRIVRSVYRFLGTTCDYHIVS